MNLEGLRRATISPKDLCEVILKANVIMRSRVRERRTHGSVRGLRHEPLVYSTVGKLYVKKNCCLRGRIMCSSTVTDLSPIVLYDM